MRLLPLFLLLISGLLSAQSVGDKQTGLASYYSNEYNGAETAYNVIYNKDELVAAHKSYPYNSTVRVRNEENGRTVVVRIIDKGPFIRGRIIELSERAAANLDMLGRRTVPVELTLLSTPDQRARVEAEPEVVVREPVSRDPVRQMPDREATVREQPVPRTQPQAQPETVRPTPPPTREPVRTPTPAPAQRNPTLPATPPPAPTVTAAAQRQVKTTNAGEDLNFATKPSMLPGVYKINVLEPPAGDYGVQVGSFSSVESALDKVIELQGRYFENILIHLVKGTQPPMVYKVILGPFEDQASAQNYASDLKSRYKIAGFTVNLRPAETPERP